VEKVLGDEVASVPAGADAAALPARVQEGLIPLTSDGDDAIAFDTAIPASAQVHQARREAFDAFRRVTRGLPSYSRPTW
jgi:hypothetical protein